MAQFAQAIAGRTTHPAASRATAPTGTAVAQEEASAVEAPKRMFGDLLKLLSDLDRRGHEAEVGQLRWRLRVAVRERPLDEVYTEIVAVRDAADALGRTS